MCEYDAAVQCTSPEETQTIVLKDLSALRSVGQEEWIGPPLTVQGLQYRLSVYLNQSGWGYLSDGEAYDRSKYVGIFAYLCDNQGDKINAQLDPAKHGVEAHSVRLRFDLTSLNTEKSDKIVWQKKIELEWKRIAEDPNCSWGAPQAIPVDTVKTGHNFKIVVQIAIAQQPLVKTLGMATKVGSSRDRLASDIGKLFEATECSDVDFHVEGIKIPAHKLILSARSAVFKAMFQSDFQEAGDRAVVHIADASSKSLKAFLHFVYRGELPCMEQKTEPQKVAAKKKATASAKGKSNARAKKDQVSVVSDIAESFEGCLSHDEQLELLGLADKYGISDLVSTSSELLSSGLHVENVARTISFADRHQCQILKDAAIKFAIKSPATFAQVRVTEDFKNLDADCLVGLLDAFNGFTNELPSTPHSKKRKIGS